MIIALGKLVCVTLKDDNFREILLKMFVPVKYYLKLKTLPENSILSR